ncbi:radical SAM family heme chaperone HemW [Pseudofulvibacter geojedonensis]|uniref:Heme chaperone HemW n=1 Tax=Pseudofulvibacter geojedonensis TaxID=1123758 RepID=A0ABW3I0A2_9FLAO
MSGIYIHIPFCKQACHYCDFHFSTSLKKRDEMIAALIKELILRKPEVKDLVETIYFGGGTPSLLSAIEITQILDVIYSNYQVISKPEITLEANPDDLSEEKIKAISTTKVNRLSIGVQSFFEEDLAMMNRAHNAEEANECLRVASQYFNNITVDLIYGIPNMSLKNWENNIDKALSFGINHISSYALTVEPKTALEKLIEKGKLQAPKDKVSNEHFQLLVQKLEDNGFIHYELSNFGKPNFFSKHNTSYWTGKNYIGIGPSAHSFNGKERSWNVANNSKYINAIQQNKLPEEKEILSVNDCFNEYVMTGLRTIFGISLIKVEQEFGSNFKKHLLAKAAKFINEGLLYINNQNVLLTTGKGKFLCDGIASDLFVVDKLQ